MKSILDTYQVRPGIISAPFNPQIFKVSLTPVMTGCKDRPVAKYVTIFTDSSNFFRNAT